MDLQEKEGILLINKPKGLTSHDVVSFVRKTLNIKKVGHTGTLDPMATGLLVLLLGSYTKKSNEITHNTKEYKVSVKLGIETDSLDITGNVLKEEKTNVNKEEFINIINSFKCTYSQEVPAYSAVKVNGKKLYEYARKGEHVELPKKEVTIYDIWDIHVNDEGFEFSCKVSSGTYIRSLIRDICHKYNTIGTMDALERINVGEYLLEEAYTLKDIEDNRYILKKI